MKQYSDCLDRDINKISPENIAEKIYLIYSSYAFRGKEDLQYSIYKEISEHFEIPITSIKLCGSGHLGYSYYKSTNFDPKVSDLDIAIINTNLFSDYLEKVIEQSNGLEPISFYQGDERSYKKYLAKGWLRPDFMPKSKLRSDWFSFFGTLSNKYIQHFAKINAGIFLSEKIFNHQQKSLINIYLNKKQSNPIFNMI